MVTFSCKIVSPEGIVFNNQIWQLSVRSTENSFVLRGRHADLIFAVDQCVLEIASTAEMREIWTITVPLLEFSNNQCTIVCKNSIKS